MEKHSYFINNQEALSAAIETIVKIFSQETGEEIVGIKSIEFLLNKEHVIEFKQPVEGKDPGANENKFENALFFDHRLPCYPTPRGWICPRN
jgi:hypothetical protein